MPAGCYFKRPARMEHSPEPCQFAPSSGRDAIERVVRGDHHYSEKRHGPCRQKNQRRQHDHRPTDRPKHRGGCRMIIKIKSPAETLHPGDLQERQPYSPAQQEPGKLTFDPASSERKEGAGPCQKNEHRRAEMSDPAREEQRGKCFRQVGWLVRHIGKEVPHMVQRHQHHHKPPKQIDRLEPRDGARRF